MVQESGKNEPEKQQHTLRAADTTVLPLTKPEKQYFERIASRTTQILRSKIKSGKLKPQSSKRHGHVNKVAVFMIILAVTFSSVIAYAQYQGQIQAQTSVRAPIYVPNPKITINDIWLNTSRSIIVDNFFILNTAGRVVTFQLAEYGTITFSNGTQSQDMSRVFSQLVVTVSDYSRNLTVVNLLNPLQPVSFAPFTYSVGSDQQCRIIIFYSAKAVNLGGTQAGLIFNLLYSYSGQ